jgi:hypothetical protein
MFLLGRLSKHAILDFSFGLAFVLPLFISCTTLALFSFAPGALVSKHADSLPPSYFIGTLTWL